MAKPDLKVFRDRMDKSVTALKDDYAGLRTGRSGAVASAPATSRKASTEASVCRPNWERLKASLTGGCRRF